MIALLPCLCMIAPLPEGSSPAESAQVVFEHLDDLLAGQKRVRRRTPGNERVVDNHRRLLAEVAVVAAVRTGGVAQDVFEWVWRGTHVEFGHAEETGAILVVVFLAVTGDVLSPDDALPVFPVPRECQAGHAVAFSRHRLAGSAERKHQL